MPDEIAISIILTIIAILIGITGGTMPQQRSKIPPVASAACAVSILVLLILYWQERISQSSVLYGAIILVVIDFIILIVCIIRQKESKETPHLALFFNEAKPDYKQVNGDEETYRVGLSAIGGKVENPEVFVHSLFREIPQYMEVTIHRNPLTPISSSITVINVGIPPTYFVNVFKHKAGQREIEFCYLQYTSEPTKLESGEYQLILRARGSNTAKEGRMERIRLLLKLDEHSNLKVSRKIEE